MSTAAEEAARIVDGLPSDEAQVLLEFARYLAEKADEEEWDRRFSEPRYAPKFQALLAEVEQEIAAGKSEPLDPNRL